MESTSNLYFLSEIITATLAGFMMNKTVVQFLLPKKGFIYKFASFILFAMVFINVSWIGDENPLILFPFFIGVFLICYQGPWYCRLIISMIFFSLLEPLCMMVDTASSYLMHSISTSTENTLILVKFGVWVLIWILLRIMISKNRIHLSTPKLWGLLGVLTLAPLFSTLSFTIWNAKFFGDIDYHTVALPIAYTVLPFTILSSLALLAALVVLSRHERLEEQQKLAEIQKVYYDGLQREQKAVRVLRHDMHNHIATAYGLLENEDSSGAKVYLEKLSHSPALSTGKRYCENDIVNALITSKLGVIEQFSIYTDFEVSLQRDLNFPEVELCALLGNALDNSIEAAKEALDKRIVLKARADKGLLMLNVRNTFKYLPKEKEGGFKTRKKDTESHGFGFAQIQEITKRYGGVCKAEYTETEFSLIVSIPLKK